MAYEKQTWQSGDTITAVKLNHMEDGIAAGGSSYDLELCYTYTSDGNNVLTGHGISFAEIVNKLEAGETVSCLYTKINEAINSITQCIATSFNKEQPYDNWILSIEAAYQGGVYVIIYTEESPSPEIILESNSIFTYTYDSTTKEFTFTYDGSTG